MTMLTPLGRGPRRGRRWPRILLVIIVLALVATAAYGAWRWLDGRSTTESAPESSPTRTCTTPTPDVSKHLPSPADITVTVANGTDRSGLAIDTADQLATRGFVVTRVGNTDKPVKQGVAQVRFAKNDLKRAVVVASYVPDAELVEVRKVSDAQVALWLGPEFTKVVARSAAAPEEVTLPPSEPVCTKKKSSS